MEIKRILIVDDSQAILSLLTRALQNHGYEVIKAATGEEALDLFEEQAPDAVVLDLNLPGLPGWEVCRVLKKRSSIPIVIMTGNATLQLATREHTQGADGYLLKPFHLQTLFEVLHNVLSQQEPAQQSNEIGNPYPRAY